MFVIDTLALAHQRKKEPPVIPRTGVLMLTHVCCDKIGQKYKRWSTPQKSLSTYKVLPASGKSAFQSDLPDGNLSTTTLSHQGYSPFHWIRRQHEFFSVPLDPSAITLSKPTRSELTEWRNRSTTFDGIFFSICWFGRSVLSHLVTFCF